MGFCNIGGDRSADRFKDANYFIDFCRRSGDIDVFRCCGKDKS